MHPGIPRDTGLRPAPLRENGLGRELHGVLGQGGVGGWESRPDVVKGGRKIGDAGGLAGTPGCLLQRGHLAQVDISQSLAARAGPRLGKNLALHTHTYTPGDTHTHTHTAHVSTIHSQVLYQQHVCTTPNPHECSDIGCPRGLRRTDTCPVHECRRAVMWCGGGHPLEAQCTHGNTWPHTHTHT